MLDRSKVLLALAACLIIAAVVFLKDFGSKAPDDRPPGSPVSAESTPATNELSGGGILSGNQSEHSESSTPGDVAPDRNAQQTTSNINVVLPEASKSGEKLSTARPGNMQNSTQESSTTPPVQRTFKGIKQANNDVMVSEIKYAPGDSEDGFVATFQSGGGAKGFDGNVWIIGDYVQRGTTGIMAMPSHSELKLAADGSPANPKGGLRLTVRGGRAESLSRKFSVKRPGFDGEELSQIRIGIYDRSTGKVHIAKVSAAELAKKRSTKRVRVDGAN